MNNSKESHIKYLNTANFCNTHRLMIKIKNNDTPIERKTNKKIVPRNKPSFVKCLKTISKKRNNYIQSSKKLDINKTTIPNITDRSTITTNHIKNAYFKAITDRMLLKKKNKLINKTIIRNNLKNLEIKNNKTDRNYEDFNDKNHISNKIKIKINKNLLMKNNKIMKKKIKATMKNINHNNNNNLNTNLNNTTTDNKTNQIKNKKLELNYITNLNTNDNEELQYKKISNTLTNTNTNNNAKKIKFNYPKPHIIDTNIPHRQDYINNIVNNTISASSKNNNNFKNGILFGKKILSNYNKILSKNENSNYRHTYMNTNINDSNYYRGSAFNFDIGKNLIKTEHVIHRLRKPNPIRTRSQLKTYSNSVRNHKIANYLESKKNNVYTPAQFTYLSSLAKFSEFNQQRKTPNYIINKNNVEKKRYIDLKSNNAISSIKKNPFLTIRNTVINVNMINPELFMTSSFNNKRNYDKKRKLNLHNKYYQNGYFTKVLPTNGNKLENSCVHKNTGFSNYEFRLPDKIRDTRTKQYSFINALNENYNNRLKAICTSVRMSTNYQLNNVNQLMKKMRYPELFNKMQIHSNSLEKGHMKYNSMKLDNIGRFKNIKQTQECTNNHLNNGNIRSMVGMNNYNLPSLVINKTVESENKGYLIKPQQKYFYPKMQRIKNVNKIKSFHLKGINQKLNK